MKKVSLFLSKELQGFVDSDQEFRKTDLLKNALALAAFVTEMALTGDRPPVTFLVINSVSDYLDPQFDDEGCLRDVLRVATRLEIHLRSGSLPGAGIQLGCSFYKPGKNIPTLQLVGYVEHSAVRCLRLASVWVEHLVPVKQG